MPKFNQLKAIRDPAAKVLIYISVMWKHAASNALLIYVNVTSKPTRITNIQFMSLTPVVRYRTTTRRKNTLSRKPAVLFSNRLASFSSNLINQIACLIWGALIEFDEWGSLSCRSVTVFLYYTFSDNLILSDDPR